MDREGIEQRAFVPKACSHGFQSFLVTRLVAITFLLTRAVVRGGGLYGEVAPS